MGLSHAILVCLSEEPLTGYDLAKKFESSVGFFWHATHQQIYLELRRLSTAGAIAGRAQPQSRRPAKTIYELTDTGRAQIRAWSRNWADPPAIKDDILLRLYDLADIDRSKLVEHLTRRREMHAERLALYEKILSRKFADPERLGASGIGRYLALDIGMRSERMRLEWCADALKLLDIAE